MHETHARHDHAPEEHDARQEDTRAEALQHDVGGGFEEAVRDEEDCQADVVLPVLHVQVWDQPVDFGVADVGAVEEADEIEEGEPGDQFVVELPPKLFVL